MTVRFHRQIIASFIMSKNDAAQEFGAGASIGMLIGLIMGLSASPVVSTVLGALAAGLLGILGINAGGSKEDNNTTRSRGAVRVLGFGFFCATFVLVGILLRTHNTLAPSLAAQDQELASSSSLSKAEQHQILLLKAFGLTVAGGEKDSGSLRPAGDRNVAGSSAPVLFASRPVSGDETGSVQQSVELY